MDVLTWWADMSRDNDLVCAGERVLRFPAFVVREQPALVARQVGTALQAAGWSPHPPAALHDRPGITAA